MVRLAQHAQEPIDQEMSERVFGGEHVTASRIHPHGVCVLELEIATSEVGGICRWEKGSSETLTFQLLCVIV